MTRVAADPSPPVTHVVVDYGGVVSTPQPEPATRALTDAAVAAGGASAAEVTERYWAERLAYDRGDHSDASYWSAVAGTAVDAGGATLAQLVELDVASWSHVRRRSVETLDLLAGRGHRLALLSNTPAPHAAWMLDQPWASHFDVHVFSYRLRVAKPAAAIFQHTLDALGCRAGEAVLVDDREPNVAGARAVGMRAVHFVADASWSEVLGMLTPPVTRPAE